MSSDSIQFDQFISTITNTHYFDTEKLYKNVTKSPYDTIIKDDFGIIIEYRMKFGKKIGHARGGIRFNKENKSREEFLTFVEFLKSELKRLNYMFIGLDHVEEENEFNSIFPKTDFREHMHGTAFIYPKKDWINKFNSKKRYDLTYAAKKDVEIELITDANKIDIDQIHSIATATVQRNGNAFPFPSKEVIKRYFEYIPFILGIAKQNDKILCFNMTFFNPQQTIAERVYAGSTEEGQKLRAPSLLEIKMVEYLTEKGITTYDLWSIKEGIGATEFKKSIADKLVYYAPYSIIKIDPLLSDLTINLIKAMKLIKR